MGIARPAAAQGIIDLPMAQGWTVTQAWTPAVEREFGEYVHAIGVAVAAHRCRSLAGCLNDPSINPLFAGARRPLHLAADCGDVPYILRAYFAWRRGLPFAHAAHVRGRGHDARYARGARAVGVRLWSQYRSPRSLIEGVGSAVHSGYFRADPADGTSDFYPIAVSRESVHAGTVYYNPNGHVLVVYDVAPDGQIQLIDGHTHGGMTATRFTERLALGAAWQVGGFQNFRPIAWTDGRLVRTPNAALDDYDAIGQHDRSRWRVNAAPVGYHAWVRASVARGIRRETTRLASAATGPQG